MTVHELQQEILRLKREKNICILAHAYQSQPVLEVADYTGDSYGLSVQAAKTNADGVIMCGVRFMAETCKILSPEKTVWLANPMAGCPMAEQLDLPTLQELKKQYPGYAVVAYINTTSELKTACDVCVTSSSALKICSALENDKILFIPQFGRLCCKAAAGKAVCLLPRRLPAPYRMFGSRCSQSPRCPPGGAASGSSRMPPRGRGAG